MKKTVLIGVILSCFLLLVTPCINAVEYKEVKESREEFYKSYFSKYIINKFKSDMLINSLPSSSIYGVGFISFFFLIFVDLLTWYSGMSLIGYLFFSFILAIFWPVIAVVYGLEPLQYLLHKLAVFLGYFSYYLAIIIVFIVQSILYPLEFIKFILILIRRWLDGNYYFKN